MSYSIQQLQQHATKGIAMEQSCGTSTTPHSKLVRVRSSRAVPKNGSASDGDDVVITSVKLSPRGGARNRIVENTDVSLSETSPLATSKTMDSKPFDLLTGDEPVPSDEVVDAASCALSKKLNFTEKISSYVLDIAETDSGKEENAGFVVPSTSRQSLEVR
jgi:hypothetical protein